MEFWGVEVKPGQSLKVKPQLFDMIHISQASLGEFKNVKGNTNVPLRLKIDGKTFVIGFLSTEDRPQILVDLVFEKEFELSHDWKHGSVYFIGYTAEDGSAEMSDDEYIPSDEDVELPNGFPVKGEPQINLGGNSDSDESEDDDASEDSSDFSSGDDEPLPKDNAQENSSSDDEPEPPKQNQSKKKHVGPVAALPTATKKPKLAAPQKTGAKNGQAGKAPSPKNASKAKNGKRPFQKKA